MCDFVAVGIYSPLSFGLSQFDVTKGDFAMKVMNHAEYKKSLQKKSWSSLWFTAKDAMEAAQAYPEGENASYYLDEVNYCLDEIARRSRLELKVKVKDQDTIHTIYSDLSKVGFVMREIYPTGHLVSSRAFDKAAATELLCGGLK